MTSQPSPGQPGHGVMERDAQFEALYASFAALLRRFFQGSGCSADESWDLAHDTLLRAYRGLDSFRHEASEKTWVLKIAARVLSNHFRARATAKRRAHVVPLDESTDPGASALSTTAPAPSRQDDSPLAIVLNREARDLVGKALDGLPPQMRRCMLLYVTQDRKYREIAVILRISIGAVKSQIHEAREHLRARLSGHFGLGDR